MVRGEVPTDGLAAGCCDLVWQVPVLLRDNYNLFANVMVRLSVCRLPPAQWKHARVQDIP